MHYFKFCLSATIILIFGSFHATAMGFLPPEDLSETHELRITDADSSDDVNFQKCLPHKATPDEICYISGGVGADEVAQFKSRAKEFLLEIVFVQKTDPADTDRKEEYLAEVQLQIKDNKGNVVVDTLTEGPFFLADLPFGSYQIIADHDGVIKKNAVKISARKNQRIVFLWPR